MMGVPWANAMEALCPVMMAMIAPMMDATLCLGAPTLTWHCLVKMEIYVRSMMFVAVGNVPVEKAKTVMMATYVARSIALWRPENVFSNTTNLRAMTA